MADFATASITAGSQTAPFGGHPGHVHAKLSLSTTAYANGNLNLSTVVTNGHIIQSIARVFNIQFTIANSAAAYMVIFTPAASPTISNLGTLKLFTTTSVEASGSLSLDIYVSFIVPPPAKLF